MFISSGEMAEYRFTINRNDSYPSWPGAFPEVLLRSCVSGVTAHRLVKLSNSDLERSLTIAATPQEYVAESEITIDEFFSHFDRDLRPWEYAISMKPHPELVDWVWYRARRMKEAFHGYVHQSSPRFRRPTDKRALPRGVSIVSLDDQERGLGRITWRLERRSIDPHFLYGVLRFGLLHPAEVVVTYDPEHTAELDPRDLSPDPRARW